VVDRMLPKSGLKYRPNFIYEYIPKYSMALTALILTKLAVA